MKLYVVILWCGVVCYASLVQSSKIHQEDFGGDVKHYSGAAKLEAGFSKDVMRDQELFGLAGSASSSSSRKYSDNEKSVKYFPKKYDKLITRTERKDRYKHVKPLNSLNKPKYSDIERSPNYKTERSSETTNLIDASRFDYDVDNYDYIEEETEKYFNDFADYEESSHDRIENRIDDVKLKRKYLDERLSSYLGLDKVDRRNIRIHTPSRSSAKIPTKRPKKKIIIRRFKKSSPRTSKKNSKRSKRKNTKLTPAEEHYLKMKSQQSSPPRQTKLRARSISDSLEGASHHPRYEQSLHGHDLQGAILRGATGYSDEKYAEPKKVQFQIHGQGGPNSYRFGHDTGIGYNRQFRYEERDDYGHVKGRYGYYDQTGDLKIVNYSADPRTGYHVDIEAAPPG